MIENSAIATIDGPRHDQGGAEYRSGHVTVTGDQITAVGEGPADSVPDGARRIDADGCLASPGLDTDTALAATEEVVRRFHDPSPGAMCGWRPRRAPPSR